MKIFKNITLALLVLIFASSCKKEAGDLSALDNVSAPANVSATFDITQDNTGFVTIYPSAEGATNYEVLFGDTLGETPTKYGLFDEISHVYDDGVYNVSITALGITGLTSTYEQEINVSFIPPENLVVTIAIDDVNPGLVSVTAVAEYATIMDVYFGDVEGEEPTHTLPGETITHAYAEAGDYIVRVVAKNGSPETTEYSETITISAASDPVTLPVTFESFTVNYAFTDFGNAAASVIDNPDATGINTSARVAQFVKPSGAETWAGSFLTLGAPIDFSVNKLFKVKVWSPKDGALVKMKIENLTNGDINYEVDAYTTVSSQWEELTYDFAGVDINNEYQKIVLFFDFGNPGDDAVYYFDDIQLTGSSPGAGVEGTWKMASEAGSLGVGPSQGDMSWWAIDDAGVLDRGCFFDDTYVFNSDGSFNNVLGDETWVEEWQSGFPDACGTPVAPHNGTVAATYTYDEVAGTVMVNGTGAYLGIPKAYNGGELTTPDNAPESITYIIAFSEDNTVMTLDIDAGGAWWRFKLIKDGGSVVSPYEGIWQMAPEAGSLGVGPSQGDMSWWAIDDAGVADRGCFFDDTYVFNSDGSFSNVLGAETWVEEWQNGVPDACGTPVAPHDGNTPATYTYDEGAGTVTVNGVGSYLGIPKAYNGGELAVPGDASESITYVAEFSEDNTVLTLDIDIGGGWWRFKLVKN